MSETKISETKISSSINSNVLNDQNINLITRGLQEVIDPDNILKKIVQKRPLKLYWGTAPTHSPSIGYLYPMMKIADFLNAGCDVTILFADLHAMLDNMKSNPKQIEARTKYYEVVIKSLLEILGVKIDSSNLKFVIGSSFQLKPEYTMDMYKLGMQTSLNQAQRAGAEVVKQTDNPLITGLLYPMLQALDEHYLNIDAFFGGIDQRKICVYAREYLPKIGYKPKIDLLNPIIPGLLTTKSDGTKTKMSSSDPNGKIDVIDSPKEIRKKISKTYCLEKDITDNSLLALTKNLLFPLLERINKDFVINRDEKFGGNISFKTYEELETAFTKDLHPMDLKNGVSDFLINLLESLRNKIDSNEMKNIIKQAYSK